MSIYEGFLKSGGPDIPNPGTRKQTEAIFTPLPPALNNPSELNSVTKGRTEPLHQAPTP